MCTVVCTLVRLGSGQRHIGTGPPQTCCHSHNEADPEVSLITHWDRDLNKRFWNPERHGWVNRHQGKIDRAPTLAVRLGALVELPAYYPVL